MDSVAIRAASRTLRRLGAPDAGLELRIRNGIPNRSGLGGTASTAAATVWAVNLLFGEPLSKAECVVLASEAALSGYSDYTQTGRPRLLQDARVISAARTPAAVTGGFVLIRGFKPLTAVPIPFGAPPARVSPSLLSVAPLLRSSHLPFAPRREKGRSLQARIAGANPLPRLAPAAPQVRTSRARSSAACGSASSRRTSPSPPSSSPASRPPSRCRRARLLAATVPPGGHTWTRKGSSRGLRDPAASPRAAPCALPCPTRVLPLARPTPPRQVHVENCAAGASMIAAVQAGDLAALGAP